MKEGVWEAAGARCKRGRFDLVRIRQVGPVTVKNV